MSTTPSVLESPDPKLVQALDGYRVVVTSNEHFDRKLVEQFHEDLIVPTFSSNEVESIDMWLERLDDQKASKAAKKAQTCSGDDSDDAHFVFALALLVRESDGKCVGAAVHEVYLDSKTALISYIVVSPELRGKGAAGLLNKTAFDNAQKVLEEHFGPGCPLQGMFIEVLQVRDDDHSAHVNNDHHAVNPSDLSTFPSAIRQRVFQKLAYVALDLDLVHPGRMKGHRYNLGVLSYVHNPKYTNEFPSKVVLEFMKGLFEGILEDEGSEDTTDYDNYVKMFAGTESIRMGSEYWK